MKTTSKSAGDNLEKEKWVHIEYCIKIMFVASYVLQETSLLFIGTAWPVIIVLKFNKNDAECLIASTTQPPLDYYRD